MKKIKGYLQHALWDAMDFLQAKAPRLYRWIKKSFPRSIKQLILKTLTSSIPELLFSPEKIKENKRYRLKISYIVETSEEDLQKILGHYFTYSLHKKEIFVVNSKKNYLSKKISSVRCDTLARAILSATGDYIVFVGPDEKLLEFTAHHIYSITKKTKADIYFGNFNDSEGRLEKVYDPKYKHDFSKAALPINAQYGPKIISKDVIIRTRLPKKNASVYSYLLDVSEKTKKFVFLEKPLTCVSISKKNLDNASQELLSAQNKFLKNRYYYDKSIKTPATAKKVLFIVPSLVIGGAENVLYFLVKYLTEQKIYVEIFCTHMGGAWVPKFKKLGAKINIAKSGDEGDIIKQIKRICLSTRFDVIHTSNTDIGHNFLPVIRSFDYRPAVIDTVHSSNNPLLRHTQKYQNYLEKIIFVSKTSLENSKDLFINKDKLASVLNGIEAPFSVNISAKKKLAKPPIITYIARLSEEKNPLEVIKVATILIKRHPDWRFQIIGDGQYRSQMEKMSIKNGIKKNVEFLGYKMSAINYLKKSSLLLLTSHTEGLPITILEAQSLGIPVVSSKVGGVHEVIKNGKNGYLIDDSNDTVGYANAIEKIISGKKYYQFCKESRIYSGRYSYKDMGNKILKIYEQGIREINNKFMKKTTIAMLSFNRLEELKKTINTIYTNTKLPFEILILDNNSDGDTVNYLKSLESSTKNLNVIYEKNNLGCPGGRRKMLKKINSDYIVTIDNDMEVPKYWLRDLIIRLEEDKKIMGVCVKDIFPWGKIEFTGGKIDVGHDGFDLFNATDYRKDYNDLSTLAEFDCDWIPGGATLWRGNVTKIAEHAKEYVNAFEDFDYSIQLRRKGYRLVNCPNVIFVHNHASGYDKKKKEKEAKYLKDRNDQKGFLRSMAVFYKRTGYLMRNDKLFEMFGFDGSTKPNEVREVLEKVAKDVKPM